MSVIEELIRVEDDGTLSFGNYLMESKKKVLDFEVEGDLYKIKTFQKITRLEKNGKLLLETVPGATVHSFCMDEKTVAFNIEGGGDISVTMELSPETEYQITVTGAGLGKIKTNMSGKVNFNVEFEKSGSDVKIERV